MKTTSAPEELSKEWQALIDKYYVPPYEDKRDDEMSAEDFSKLVSISISYAKRILEEEEKAGNVTHRVLKSKRGNNKIDVYSFINTSSNHV